MELAQLQVTYRDVLLGARIGQLVMLAFTPLTAVLMAPSVCLSGRLNARKWTEPCSEVTRFHGQLASFKR
jgi:hypothetical protein